MLKTMLAAALMVALTACHNVDTTDAGQAELARAERDTLENALVNTMDEINRNLEQIRERQGIISLDSRESVNKKDEILRNITLINSLIEDNRSKIEELDRKTRQLGKENSALSRIAHQYKTRIAKQEAEITTLKEQLQQASYQVSELNQQITEMQRNTEDLEAQRTLLSESNAQMDRDMNMGYFTYGTSDELEKRGLVEKKGGLLGLGQKERLADAYTRNKALFTAVDMREANHIPVHGKHPRLLTSHPRDSYDWQEDKGHDYSTLNIKTPDDFWSTSRFVVVKVD